MSENIETFEMETISDKKTGVLIVKDFDSTIETARQIVAQHPVPTIESDEQKKVAKAFRATLNKVIKAIDRRRIDTVAEYTEEFEKSCNEIKGIFTEAERSYKTAIEAYEEAQKIASVAEEPTKRYVCTIKFSDEKLIKKITEFCVKYGLEATIK